MSAAFASPAEAAKPVAKGTINCLGWEANAEAFSSLTSLAPASTARVDDRGQKNTSAYSGSTEMPSGSEPSTASFRRTSPCTST